MNNKQEEVKQLKMEINRQKDTINQLKTEKLELLKQITFIEHEARQSQKLTEEVNKAKSELMRKDKTIQNLRMANEEFKTEKDMRSETLKTCQEKLGQLKQDVDRKDKIIWEWKSK